ncbi:MAG: VOC family protein [Acidobacteriota bacterium]|jgi:catechol 2,3-dioxygenase-like lactoylglutathione lyase family enzyme|nr:VOC family protein [Acidobacteriota bacterium]
MSTIQFVAVTLDSADWRKLSDFYVKLLGGKVVREFGGHGVAVAVPGTEIALNFQDAVGYEPPVWPEQPGKPQQMAHLDFIVEDMADAVRRATELGATKTPSQFIPVITVMLDPAGHPFCLIPKE